MRLAVLCATALLVGGCHYRPTPIPVSGERTSIAALAGTWNGTYRGIESGRTGSITFTMQFAGDSAWGDLLMETPPGQLLMQPADDPAIHRMHARNARFLAVRFIDVVGGSIEGALEPYVSADCDCTVTTRFIGRMVGDTIRGSFLTRGPLIAPQTGLWTVTRGK